MHVSITFIVSGCQDSSYIVRKSFMCKLYGLLKKHAIPVRYACAFALASTDCARDVRAEVCTFFLISLYICHTNFLVS
jgi:sister-chromatid-cohesion protein PDS5